jgi:glycosyltransferase involved in cell wall biosynthesis
LHGKVPRSEVLSAVRGTNLAVVITAVDEQGSIEDKGMVTGKIFEAIGCGTPVLLITPNDSDAATLTAPIGLVKNFTGVDIQGMTSFLKEVICGEIPHPKNVEVFSWTDIAKNLDTVLRNVISVTAHI